MNIDLIQRICVFEFSDPENVVDDYILDIVDSLNSVSERLIVIINGLDVFSGEEKLFRYTSEVIHRKNQGMDGGAFKDALLNHIGFDSIRKYDELILCNDTFYGFFFSLNDVFMEMTSENCDFWGMTRQLETCMDDNNTESSYIQSYFLVYRHNIIFDDRFYDFWKNLKEPKTFQENIRNFEISLDMQLNHWGYKSKAYMDIHQSDVNRIRGENVYLTRPFDLIRDNRLPLLKRKSLDFSCKGMRQSLDALEYLRVCGLYDVDKILRNIRRLYCMDVLEGRLNLKKLEKFTEDYKKIYIYGAGVFGRNLSFVLSKRGIKAMGYIVSEKYDEKSKNIFTPEEINWDKDTGVIIAISRRGDFWDMYNTIIDFCQSNQILSPYFKRIEEV